MRERVLTAIERIARGEAAAAGAPREPEIEVLHAFPAVVNDAGAVERTTAAFAEALPQVRVVSPGPVTGSEDVGLLAHASGAPCAFWLLGGADAAPFAGAASVEEVARIVATLPSNHSPQYAPVIEPTFTIGIGRCTRRRWIGSERRDSCSV